MGAVDWIILGCVALILAAAVFTLVKRKKGRGGCCGDCEKCRMRNKK